MIGNHPILVALSALLIAATSTCSSPRPSADATATQAPAQTVSVPAFNADSAYHFVQAQVDFGPRVPGTAAHQACADYLAATLTRLGATVYTQRADLVAYDGTVLKACNVIGAYKPESRRRIALFAHWDCRPWADNDPDPKLHHTPVPGANDGASGVGVLLEIARLVQQQQPALGIDIILLDAEDYGAHQQYKGQHREEYWCLGSQYWARNPHVPGYNARFGILLDMVGGHDAVFRYEWTSEEFAKDINRKVWRTANNLGYGSFFVQQSGGAVTDDHVFINRYARIPTIDIIPYSETASFFEHWHTVKDDMNAISRQTLQAVGQTVTEVIYNER